MSAMCAYTERSKYPSITNLKFASYSNRVTMQSREKTVVSDTVAPSNSNDACAASNTKPTPQSFCQPSQFDSFNGFPAVQEQRPILFIKPGSKSLQERSQGEYSCTNSDAQLSPSRDLPHYETKDWRCGEYEYKQPCKSLFV